jgi:uncharacterized protein (DUF2345 family)
VPTIRAEQAEAMGGCTPCQAAQPPTLTPDAAPARVPGPPVIVVDREKPSWLAIELADEGDQPLVGEPFVVTLPNGQEVRGVLDAKGAARIEGIDPGTCKVSFPERDKDGWKRT